MLGKNWKEQWRREGGGGELMRLALPLILSNSFWTLQITIDRIFLSQYDSDAIAAAMPAVLLFWTPLILFQNTANYATTFVAQYLGAGRPRSIGPAVWQAIHFSLLTGIGFLAFVPLAPFLIALGGHSANVQRMETIYFQCLCFSALPTLITAAVSSFFAGRGDSWTVLLINAVGLVVNALLDYAWIFGYWGFPEWGIAGAGWATVIGTAASALVSVILMMRPRYRIEFATLRGWRFNGALTRRLLRFGLPNGVQSALDVLAFTVFTFLVGWLGNAELAATSIAFTINIMTILPMLGIGQAICVLVGQRLGQNRPDLAERTTWTGLWLTWGYMGVAVLLFILAPEAFLFLFQGKSGTEEWPRVAALVPVLLYFVAVYTAFDGLNLVFSFALRGAGDTRFVTAVSLALAWPIMVLPSWAACYYGWGLYWAWAFASSYIIALAFVFLFRFRSGKWKSMRVIETCPAPDPVETVPAEERILTEGVCETVS